MKGDAGRRPRNGAESLFSSGCCWPSTGRQREECLADPGTIGTLSIGDIPIGTAEKRPLHAAQLWERWGTSAKRGLLPPLFDVQVLRITPRGLLLRGFQVDTSNRPTTAQHAQEWWAVPIEKPGAA